MAQTPMKQDTPEQSRPEQSTLQSLCAGVDGELPPHELRFLLRRVGHDRALPQAWSRYHLVRDCLRGQLPPLAASGFATRVSASIAQEALPAAARRRHWLRWSAGSAIAASVAVATLMLGQPGNDAEEHMVATQAAQQSTSTLAGANPTRAVAMPSVVPPWLSGNSADLLSQRASATFGSPFVTVSAPQTRQSATYPALYRYRALDNNDGSYLLLLDPAQSPAATRAAPQRATATAQ